MRIAKFRIDETLASPMHSGGTAVSIANNTHAGLLWEAALD